MSSQFSYELDERQIRILMQNGQLEYNEAAWNRFEAASGSYKTRELKPHVSTGFNFSISRSVIVPVLFVAMIGGLSVLLFSFVDFKKKEEAVKEIPLVPNADNAPKKAAVKPSPEITKPKVAVVTTSPVVKTQTIASAPVITTSAAVAANTTAVKPGEQAAKPVTQPVVAQPTENARQVSPHTTITQNTQAAPVQVKKKKKKVKYEELPSISPSANLTTESVPELKLN